MEDDDCAPRLTGLGPSKRKRYRSWLRCQQPELPRSTSSDQRRKEVQAVAVDSKQSEADEPPDVEIDDHFHKLSHQNRSDNDAVQSMGIDPSEESTQSGSSRCEVTSFSEESYLDLPEAQSENDSRISDEEHAQDNTINNQHTAALSEEDEFLNPEYVLPRPESDTEEEIRNLEDYSNWKPPEKVADLDGKLPNLPCSKFECLLMILSFSFRHGLTVKATEDLSNLINTILGGNYIPASKYMFNKVVGTASYNLHLYCSKCESYVANVSTSKERRESYQCPVCSELCRLNNLNNGYFFITFPVKEQLQFLLENTDDILNLLEHRFKRTKTDDICDVFDGKVYRELAKEGNILSSRYNLSITFNTDGAQVFESSKNTLWPIHFRANEMPLPVRFSLKNTMIAGLWFGKKEPSMPLFLSSFVSEMNTLYANGFDWRASDGKVVHSKVILLNCVVDSKAKPTIQNVKQFNGYYGCGYCTHPGVVYGEGSNQAKYPVSEDLILLNDNSFTYTVTKTRGTEEDIFQVEDRNNETMREAMETAERQRTNVGGVNDVYGVKGKSVLCALFFFDMVFGFAVDYLHCVLLGVARHVTNLWLDSSSHDKSYYIGSCENVAAINQRLLNIKPPTSITRRPRSLTERANWKGNEWRCWLLYYSIPCLIDILPSRFMKHHVLLVSSIHTLLQDKISREDLQKATWNLGVYCVEFVKLYSGQFAFYNVHLLLHLGKCVELWGPMFCYSAFSFESANGSLVKLVKGTTGVLTQIAQKYLRCKVIPRTVQMYNVSDRVISYCEDLMCYSEAQDSQKYQGITVLGPQKCFPLTSEEEAALLMSGHNVSSSSYERFIKDHVLYHARCYSRIGSKSDNSIVKLKSGKYGAILRILDPIHFRGTAGRPSLLILLREINIDGHSTMMPSHDSGARALHIKQCCLLVYGAIRVVTASEIEEKAILMDCIYRTFVTVFPNMYEKD